MFSLQGCIVMYRATAGLGEAKHAITGLTCYTSSTCAAAGRTHQHCRGQVTILGIPSSGTQLTLCFRGRLLTGGTCCVGVAVLDGGGCRGSSSGHKTDGRRCVVSAASAICNGQTDAINAAGACTLQECSWHVTWRLLLAVVCSDMYSNGGVTGRHWAGGRRSIVMVSSIFAVR